jgi:hypothetical protein
MMSSPESRVKTQIKRLLVQRGIWYFMPVSRGMGMHGIPDFICCWQGRFLAIEAKAAGLRSNVSPLQKRALASIEDHGGLAIIVDDIEQLEALLGGTPV